MSKETDIAISVTVKDGPKTLPQATKLPKDCGGINVKKAVNEEIVITEKDCHAPQCVDFVLNANQKLVFVAIHADRYKYKDACGKEQPGIIYADSVANLKDLTKRDYLDGPHVYVSRRLQSLNASQLCFQVCQGLLNCITDPDKKKVVINVTYGVGVPNEPDCATCEPCETPAANGKIPQQQQYPPAPVPVLQN